MRLFYSALVCSMLSMPIYGGEAENISKEYFLKNDIGKVLMCALMTAYKHPFMTCWSIYSSFSPGMTIVENKLGRREFRQSRGLFTWIIDALLLGDFAHNILHAYKIKHSPCIKEICFCANLEEEAGN